MNRVRLVFLLLLAAVTSSLFAQMADDQLFRSTDQGQTWLPFTEGLPAGASPAAMLEHEGQVFVGLSQGGLFVLSPGSDQWEARGNGLPNKLVIRSVAARGDLMVLGTYHGHVFTSTDRGRHWKRSVFAMMGGSVRAMMFHNDWLIAGTDNGVYRSSNGGLTWSPTEDMVQVNDLAEYQGRLYASRRDGILVSTDEGAHWSYVRHGPTAGELMVAEDKLYCRLFSGEIMRTKDGRFWEQPLMAIPGAGRQSLPAALYHGFRFKAPEDRPIGSVTETSLGWFLATTSGC